MEINSLKENKNLKILDIDPWLSPFKNDILLRMEKYTSTKEALLGSSDKFSTFANGYLYYGFHLTADGWYYREWAPGAEELFLVGDFNNWNPYSHPLVKKENGTWEIFLPGVASLQHNSQVKVRIKAKGIYQDRIPLYVRRTIQNPVTHDFTGQIWMPEKSYVWTDKNYLVNPKEPLLIYETHIGMAQEKEGMGTFKEFTQNILPRIKESGYNTIQLMAIMQHPYYASFGYHVSNFFAVSSWFGSPEDLKDLVNTAHYMGINVLMDIVHSHVVKNISEGINEFDGTKDQFFKIGEKGNHKAWDSKLFNYGKHEVIHFLLSNIKFWMEEYHFDGFRFDGVTSMIYHNHGLGVNFDNYNKYFSMNTDIEATNYLQFANELIKEIRPDAITIAEDMSGMPGMCLPIEYGGIGFDYRLTMGVPDYWIKTIRDFSDENWSMGNLWHELTSRRPQENCISYVESHDQALVGDKTLFFRLADKEIYWHMSKGDNNLIINRAMELHKLIRFSTITLSGEGYLNFMGNEFGHPEWIDFPREGNNWSYKHSRRQWNLVDNKELLYDYLDRFDKGMLGLVKEHNVMKCDSLKLILLDENAMLLSFKKNELIFLFNFNPSISQVMLFLPTEEIGDYKVIFNSDNKIFGGQGRISQDTIYSTIVYPEKYNKVGITIYSPCRTVLVLEKL